jgi:hypothetical protein
MNTIRRCGPVEYAVETSNGDKYFIGGDGALGLCAGYVNQLFIDKVDASVTPITSARGNPEAVLLTAEVVRCLIKGGWFKQGARNDS